MNINNLHGRPASSSSVRNTGADKVQPEAAAQTPSVAPIPNTDRVELSASAKAAEANGTPELAFARKALDNIPPLSPERVAEILDRIKEDYYSQPEVAREIAQRVAANVVATEFED